MNIIFTKRPDGWASLRCIRDDGSETWNNTPYPAVIRHDLTHYVVETELGFRRAFYGLLAEGYDISSFALPQTQRPAALSPTHLPQEAYQTEILVGLLQTEQIDSLSYTHFIALLVEVCLQKKVRPPSLSDTQLKAIRTRVTQLWHQWQTLREKETLRLEFILP